MELDLVALKKLSKKVRTIRPFNQEYTLKSGKRIYVLGEGRLINLASAEGHPSQVMDMSFANQSLVLEYLVKHRKKLVKKVYGVPEEIDKQVSKLKLKALGVSIDKLTPLQKKYLSSHDMGT